MKQYRVAVVGAMGAVGTEIRNILKQRGFPVASLTALDVQAHAGREVVFQGSRTTVREVEDGVFREVDIAFFAVGAEVSLRLAPRAAREGATVIDNSSAFRLADSVPLVVPEVNPEALRAHGGIIANPNCSTIIALMVLKPLHDAAGIRRMVVSTYQAVSGAGAAGLHELREQALQVLREEPAKPAVFAHRIAFNLIPQIDAFEENGYTLEEMKMLHESRKILSCPELQVCCTCVRVPVFRSHCESIVLETEKPLTPLQARELLGRAPGVRLVDDPAGGAYPMPWDCSEKDEVFVGRIREDISSAGNGLAFWCCGDQIRKGAALNAVQIAEKLAELKLC